MELSTSKQREDELVSESVSLEQTKKIAYQQHQLYEDEIHSLGAQLNKVRQVSPSVLPVSINRRIQRSARIFHFSVLTVERD